MLRPGYERGGGSRKERMTKSAWGGGSGVFHSEVTLVSARAEEGVGVC